LIDELTWEARWDQALAESSDLLDKMAEKAIEDYRAGRTKEMGFDEL